MKPGIFAEWVFGLDRQTGDDTEGKKHIGRYPKSWEEAKTIFLDTGNFVALGNFIWTKALGIVSKLVLGSIVLFVVFALWSSQKPLYVTVLVAGVASSVLGMFIGIMDTRMYFMSFPLLLVAAVLGVEGAVRFAFAVKTAALRYAQRNG